MLFSSVLAFHIAAGTVGLLSGGAAMWFRIYPSSGQPAGTFSKIRLEVRSQAEKREGKMTVRAKTGYYR